MTETGPALDFTLERYDPAYDRHPSFPMIFIGAPHWARYRWAAQFCRGKCVVDIACGSGYGTSYLAQVAQQAIGIDHDRSVIEYCRRTYPTARFYCADAQCFKLTQPVDVIVSMETIEHLPSPERFLERVCAALRSDGIFLCSTPLTGVVPQSPHHVREYTAEEFQAMLQHYFAEVSLQFQTMRWDIDGQPYHSTDMFLLAVCRRPHRSVW